MHCLFRNNSKILLGGVVFSVVLMLGLSVAFLSPVLAQDNSYSSENLQSNVEYPSELSLVEIFERSEFGVVSIAVTKTSPHGDASGVGSGFIFDKEGHIITNNHVVRDSKKIDVTFTDGTSYRAKVVGTDPYADIAVLKIDVNSEKLYPLPIGDSSKLKVGEQITAIGNPFGLSGSMTSGIVSQLGRLLPTGVGFSIPDVIQTDTAINPGNSGGPLLNMKGEVVGVNTAIYSSDGSFSGVGFSIPSNVILKIVPVLIKDGEFHHPWVGISSANITPDLAELLNLEDAKGVLVMTVVKDSPANKAGLRGSSETAMYNEIEYTIGGDIILSVDGKEVRKIDDLLTHLQREKNVGDALDLGIVRDGKAINVVLTLEPRPGS
ncbi:p70 ribosomal S6 kinase protein [Marine Group I thaumarchaeote SCGC AAA799-N04]|uniref:p70 ribosomal S6 kinase protein n=2 Tax=Marine Group I TaxID=905826 RepID=A0A081RM83_9ARCH|nr:p70 ribosomal S6 kinase protein [Marine Group I thaumarchaeote SCGC AAA799-N04]KFM15913.1 p70 ribosomal S6 kinase protein [Marine Group I thaumarchaeote SCGC AAA799-D11]